MKPVAQAMSGRPGRLIGVDASRGVALLGMIAVHVLPESDQYGHPTWQFTMFAGRAAAAFAVLAGVGIAFMTGRARVGRADMPAVAAMLATRAAAIGVIGLALGYTDASLAAVILPYYAVLFLLAIPLVALPRWAIVAVGGVFTAGIPVVTHLLLPRMPVPSLDNPTLGDLVAHPLGLLSELSITGEYPALAWTPYLCAGLVIGRLTLSRVRVAVGLFYTGTAMALAAAATSSLLLIRCGGLAHIWAAQPSSALSPQDTTQLLTFQGDGTTPASTWWWLAVDSPHTSTPLDLLGTTGSAAALLGGMLLARHVAIPPLRQVIRLIQVALGAAGSMTLTLYTAHIIFINSDYDPDTATTSFLIQATAAVALALGWRPTVGRGPLERLVSALATRVRRLVTSWQQPRPAQPPAKPAEQQAPPR
jgi:uncharacterized membrane protein